MKRGVSFCLVAALLLSLICGAGAQAAEKEAPQGSIFLTVSRIDLSVVGESEDIYVGTAPRELVSWESDDETVVKFENGVLTAVGVGTTTVRASYGQSVVECAVGCLAETREELMALGDAVLRSPKRYPPESGEGSREFFQNSAIVGDSIALIMFQFETKYNLLGHPLFLARGGTSLFGFVIRNKNIYYQGTEMYLEDAVAKSGVEKLFIMLGQNDLGYRTVEETLESWDVLLPRILEKSPGIEIYLQSCVPEWQETFAFGARNQKLHEYNAQLKEYAQEHGCHFVDIAPYAEDHIGAMPAAYSMDQGIHLNEEGCIAWMKALDAYAERQMTEGET